MPQIDVSGLGFRGGNAQINDENDCAFFRFDNDYRYPQDNWRGARKGEGIAKFIAGAEAGRGPQANGGGGGNDHNAGGGGGGHWCTGGDGGQNLITDPFGCGGRWPGLGGNALNDFTENRFFFGGGGGAGHGNNDVASDGGHGGGIVMLLTNKIQSNGFSIKAGGGHADPTTGDGAGGGGAGGAIVLHAVEVIDTLIVDISGGNGGSVENRNQARCMGPGGRGGSGHLEIGFQNAPTGLSLATKPGEAGISMNSTICTTTENQGNQPICEERSPQAFLVETTFEEFGLTIAEEELENLAIDTINDVWLCENKIDTVRVTFQGNPVSVEWTVDNGQEIQEIDIAQTVVGLGFSEVIFPNDDVDRTGWTYHLRIIDQCEQALSSSFSIAGVDQIPMGLISSGITDSIVSFNFQGNRVESYQWDFGDDNSSSLSDPIHRYAQPGTYYVSLETTNQCGTQIFQDTVIIGQNPIATYKVVGMTEGCVPLTVTFRGSSGDFLYNWSFPGGNPANSTNINPTIIYEEPGNFGLELIVGNGFGQDTLIASEVVNVFAVPLAIFEFEVEGRKVFFKNQSNHASRYFWEFGDGKNSDQENPIHEYEEGGTYQVTLNAINSGCGATTSTNVNLTITSTNNDFSSPLLKIYPNPLVHSLNLEWTGTLKDTQILVLNTNGQEMIDGRLDEQFMNWSVVGWPSGIYWVVVKQKGLKIVQKILIPKK